MYTPCIRFGKQDLLTSMRYGMLRSQASTGRRDNWGLRVTDDDASQIEDARRQTIGTMGEWAVANWFGQRYRFTVNSFKEPDVIVSGSSGARWGVQVKASEYGKHFIIRPDAKDNEPYVYCFVELPADVHDPRSYNSLPEEALGRVYIKGWMFPWEARERAATDASLIRDPGRRGAPAIFLPVDQIHPISDLMEIVNQGVPA